MDRIRKNIQLFSLLIINLFTFVKCDGEMVIIHQPPIINFYDERPLYATELRFVFGSCLGYLKEKSTEWQDIHYSSPFDFHNVVLILAVIPGVETLNITGIRRIPIIEDDEVNKIYSEIDLKTTKLFKNCPVKGRTQRFNLDKIEISGSDNPSLNKFSEMIQSDILKSSSHEGSLFYWGDYPSFVEKDPEKLATARKLLAQSMKNLADIVKAPRKALVILLTHNGEVSLVRRKRETEDHFVPKF